MPLAQMVVDDVNQIWIVSPLGNGLICYNYGSSIDDINDDHWRMYRSGPGNGNLPSVNVLCKLQKIKADLSGWAQMMVSVSFNARKKFLTRL